MTIDIAWVVSILFCAVCLSFLISYSSFSLGYVRGYRDGGNRVLDKLKETSL